MANWLDGYAILTGNIENILTFITKRSYIKGNMYLQRSKENKLFSLITLFLSICLY